MVVIRALSVSSLLLLSLLSVPAVPAQDAGPVFTEVETDASGDNPVGFWDVTSLSVAEPGDGTVALRASIADLSPPDSGVARFFFGFTAAGTAIVSGFTYEGAPTSRNIGEPLLPESCVIDADAGTGTCYYTYEDLGVAPGDTLSEIWGFVDSCAPVVGCLPGDNIPGGVAIDGWNTGGYPATYTLTGCTLADPAACPVAAPAALEVQEVFENLTAPSFLHAFENATSDVYTLNLTVPWQNATLGQSIEVRNGSANVTVLRNNETVLAFTVDNGTHPAPGNSADNANETAEQNANERSAVNGTDDNATEAPVLPDAAGNWTIVIEYDGFVGTLGLELSEYVAPSEPEVEGNETAEPALSADSEDAPGLALPVLGIALLAAVFIVRRRD